MKLGFMSFFVKACVAALQAVPRRQRRGRSAATSSTRSTTTSASRCRRRRASSCRCCATATSCRSPAIEKGILELAERARDRQARRSTISPAARSAITNGGIYGSMMSTPLLNYPQTGILGMHNIVKRAVVVGDEIKIRPMMYVALSLRPPRRRRPRGGVVPGRGQGAPRGARAHARRGLAHRAHDRSRRRRADPPAPAASRRQRSRRRCARHRRRSRPARPRAR